MKGIYILNVRMTGANGGIIQFVESAFIDVELAIEQCYRMDEVYKDDPNYMAYITGPILLNENRKSDLA